MATVQQTPVRTYDPIYSPVAKWLALHDVDPAFVASVPDSPGAEGCNAAVAEEMRWFLASAQSGAAVLTAHYPDGVPG